jgi:hypothetical protein
LTQEAVKIEQPRRNQGIHIVLVVEAVEHFDLRNQLVAVSKMERPSPAPIEGEEAIVFAQVVASAIDTVNYTGNGIVLAARGARSGTQRIIGDRLRRVRLDARTEFEAVRQLHVPKQIEFVSLIAIGERVVPTEVKAVEVAEGEGIALVRVVVEVF